MMLLVQDRPVRRAALAACLACAMLSVTSAQGKEDRVSGTVWEVVERRSITLMSGVQLWLNSDTVIRAEGRVYGGPILVGWRVEARGRLAGAGDVMTVRELKLERRGPDGRVKGEARVESVERAGGQLEILADGRRLVVSSKTRWERRFVARESAAHVMSEIVPGDFLRYEGVWSGFDRVQVRKFAAWANVLEEGERLLHERFEPTVLFSSDPGAEGAVLQSGPNRFLLLPDRTIQQYVNELGTELLPPALKSEGFLAGGGRTGLWFQVTQDTDPQALAFPGGMVVVHQGLLTFAENEAQAAFVIGHELAHISEEHAWRERNYHKNVALRWATAGIGLLVETIRRKGYSRELEDQADRLALSYLVRAGYDPREGIRFLRKVESLGHEVMTIGWFDSHRALVLRQRGLLEELPQILADQPAGESPPRRDSERYQSIRLRIPKGPGPTEPESE